jgi:hypothetical protein
MTVIREAIKFARLAWGLRQFLSSTLTIEETKTVVSARLQNRADNFLKLLKKGVYQYSESPYLQLLRISGCEYGDIEKLVREEGVEGALQKLYEAGIYLKWEEFKGKCEVTRGSQRFRTHESDFDNPYQPILYQLESSGTRSAGTRTTFDLDHRVEESHYHVLMLTVNNARDYPLALWKPIPPSASGIGNLLNHWKAGKPVDKWFSPVDEREVQSPLIHRIALRYILYCSYLWRKKLAKPEYVKLNDSIKIASWAARAKETAGGVSLSSSVSLMVKICESAIDKGLDLSGAHLFVSGEPLTDAKRELMEATGAFVIPKYSIVEIGRIALGCPNLYGTNSMHLLHDSIGVIQRLRQVDHTDVQVNSFLFTSILPTAPKILLNVESDDYGELETHDCDCLFGQIGFNRRISKVKSFAKLTGSGMTVVGSELGYILEKVLPDEYGGSPTDYQLLEEEDSSGMTHLSLIISPAVGKINNEKVLATVLNEIRKNAGGGKLAAGLWSQINTMQVRRIDPISKAGKISTLHLLKPKRKTKAV